jgi:hypothetical protein
MILFNERVVMFDLPLCRKNELWAKVGDGMKG